MKKEAIQPDTQREVFDGTHTPSLYQKPGKQPGNAGNRYSDTRSMPVDVLEKLLAECAGEIYLRGGQRLTPLQPFVLVRVIPKEMVSAGGIMLPDVRQNKPVAEGIVLETYRPYTQEVPMKRTLPDGTEEEYIGIAHFECPLKTGQRILFPYYEGVEHQLLGDNYKLIRVSADQIKFPYMQVLGTVDYEGDLLILSQITELMHKFRAVTTSGKPVSRGGDPK